MNVLEVLQKGKEILKPISKSPLLDCEILLQHTLKKKTRTDLFLMQNYHLNQKEENFYFKLINKRKNYYPVAKILNKKEFWGIDISLEDKKVLIPRPETEVLVELAIKFVKKKGHFHFLDLGTGTGCISVALLKAFKNCKGEAWDISKNSIYVAKKNLYEYDRRCKIFRKSIFFDKTNKLFDLIISNPPYLKECEFLSLDKTIKRYEPKNALVSDNHNGTSFYEKIIKNFKNNIKVGGALALEIGNGQFNYLNKTLLENKLKVIEVFKVFNREPRCILATKF